MQSMFDAPDHVSWPIQVQRVCAHKPAAEMLQKRWRLVDQTRPLILFNQAKKLEALEPLIR